MPSSALVELEADSINDAKWLRPPWFALLLGVLVFASFPQVLLGMQTFVYRDYGLFAYPNAHYFRESFWRGEIPLWNPLNNCGQPFLAQWNTQVLYPPSLFYLLFPLSWSLGVFCLLHLFLGGLGMYFLAERWTGNRLAAAGAGIAFAFNGLMLNSLMWPAIIPGLGWMPWIVWLTERAWREGGRMIIAAAITGALQMISGAVEVVLMTWAVLGALGAVEFIGGKAPRGAMAARSLCVVLLITGLCAAQLLPFFDLLEHSHRQQNFRATDWPMPLTGLGNLLVPLLHCNRSHHGVFLQTGQYWTASYYVGVATVALAMCALWRPRRWRVWLLAALVAVCTVMAFGDATPIYRWLSAHVSAFNLMRFPVKFMIVPVFALPLLAAFALATGPNGGRREPPGLGRHWWTIWLVAIGLIALVLGLAYKFPQPHDDWPATWRNGVARALFFTGIVAVLFLAGRTTGIKLRRLLQFSLLFLLWLDLYHHVPLPQTVNRSVYTPNAFRSPSAPRTGDSRAMVSQAARTTLPNWMFDDPAEDYRQRRATLFANCNLLDNIPKLDGFFPLYLRIHMPIFWRLYDDTNAPPSPLLDFLGVSQMTSATNFFDWLPRSTFLPLLTGGQKPIFADSRTTMAALGGTNFNPRAEVYLPLEEKARVAVTNGAAVKISDAVFVPHHITAKVESSAPVLVVAAQTYYHLWHAQVDGKPVPLLRANFAFQALEVPAGRHELRLVYRDNRFLLGSIISLATLLGCVVAWLSFSRRATGAASNAKECAAAPAPQSD
jgi:hypothetical protein